MNWYEHDHGDGNDDNDLGWWEYNAKVWLWSAAYYSAHHELTILSLFNNVHDNEDNDIVVMLVWNCVIITCITCTLWIHKLLW